MKQRVLSIILTLTMVLSLLPATAWAADGNNDGIKDADEFLAALGGAATANGTTITLSNNITVTDNIRVKGNFKLELAGHTLDMGSHFLIADEGASLTIQGDESETGGTIKGTSNNGVVRAQRFGILNVYGITIQGSTSAPQSTGIVAGLDSTVNVHNTTIKDTVNGIVVLNGATLNYYDTTITSIGNGIATKGTSDGDNPTIYIYSGTIETAASNKDSVGIYLPATGGNTYIYGGTIKGNTGIEIRAGNLEVSKGTITSTSTAATSADKNASGSTVVGAGIAVSPHAGRTVNVVISGGNISGPSGLYFVDTITGETIQKITASVSGGTFTSTNDNNSVVIDKTSVEPKKFISGGTFSDNAMKDFVIDKKAVVGSGNSFKVIEEGSEVQGLDSVAKVNNLYYDSFEAAVDAAQAINGDNKIVEIIANIENNRALSNVLITESLRIQLNGYRLYRGSYTIFVSGEKAELIIEGDSRANIISGGSQTIFVDEGASLTVNSGTVINTSDGMDAICVVGADAYTTSTVTIEPNGKVIAEENNATGVYVMQYGTLNVSGTIEAKNVGSVAVRGSYDARSTLINITDGSIEAGKEGCAIYHPQNNGKMNITGGTITGGVGIVAHDGTITIGQTNGGEKPSIKAIGTEGYITVDGESFLPAAIVFDQVSEKSIGSVTIKSGKIVAAKAGQDAVIYTKSGKLSSCEDNIYDAYIEITGGTFSTDVRYYEEDKTETNFVPDTHTVVQEGIYYTVVEGTDGAVMVTSSSGKKDIYSELGSALSAAKGAESDVTITLLKSISKESGPFKIYSTDFINIDNVTLNLNGKNITGNVDGDGLIKTYGINLTITGKGTIANTGAWDEAGHSPSALSVFYKDKGGEVTIDSSVTLQAEYPLTVYDNEGAELESGPAITIKGTIQSVNLNQPVENVGPGVYVHGDLREKGLVIIVEDGAVISGNTAIYAAGNTDLQIEGGKITGSDTGIEIRNGELKVTGGIIKSANTTVREAEAEPNNNGSTVIGAGIAVSPHIRVQTVKVTIEDGDISGPTALYFADTNTTTETADTIEPTINGGIFYSSTANGKAFDIYEIDIEDADGKLTKVPSVWPKKFISGGSFRDNTGKKYPVDDKDKDYLAPNRRQRDDNGKVVPSSIAIVTFNANGGVFSDGSEIKEIETDLIFKLMSQPDKPTQTGFDFKGWFTAADGGIEVTVTEETEFRTDTTLYAHWERNTPRKITFKHNYENSPADIEVDTGSDGIVPDGQWPDNPTRDDYRFDGWYTAEDRNAGVAVDRGKKFDNDTILYAQWTKLVCTITFDLNYPNAPDPTTATTTNNKLTSLPTQTRTGYNFEGWYTQKEGGAKVTTETEFMEDTIIFAHWSLYVITFDLNYENAPAPTTATVDSDGKLAETDWPIPTRNGYTFEGWYENSEHTASETKVTTDKVFTKDTTLYAHWTEKPKEPPFTITFNLNYDGAPESTTEKTDEKGILSEPEDPEREGYTFLGWYTKATNGTEVNFNEAFMDDTTIYAHWKKSPPFTITFDPNGGVFADDDGGELEKLEVKTDTDGKLSADDLPDDPTYEGYDFEGWYTAAENGTKVDFDEAFADDTTVYARWKKQDVATYIITFDPNGGEMEDSEKTATTGADGKLSSLPEPTRSGYTFDGWYTEKEGGDKVTTDTVFMDDATLYAHWKDTQTGTGVYTITFNPNGGTVTPTTAETEDGKLASLPTPTREGYTFNGWYTAAEGGIRVTTDTVFTENTTIYAHWAAAVGDYFINVYASPIMGGYVIGGGYYNRGDSVTLRAIPANGYHFAYWMEYGTIVSTSAVYTFTATMNRTLVAVFEQTSGNDEPSISAGHQISIPTVSNGSISISRRSARPGDTVIITAAPNAGYAASISVTDRNGNSIFVRDNGDGTFTFTMPDSQVTISAAFNPIRTPVSTSEPSPGSTALPFNDVSTANWFYPAVQYVYANGLMTGEGGPSVFNPRSNMTRVMVWTVLGRMAGADIDGGITPPWYAKVRDWVVEGNISDGMNPTYTVSRQELMTMLWRYMRRPSVSADLSRFKDHADVSSWSKSAMQWAVATGLIVGDNGRLNPNADVTRCEVATIVMRFCENVRR